MSIEEILRRAQKANGAPDRALKSSRSEELKDDYHMLSKHSSESDNPKFYEKTWFIFLLLIFLCPLGLICLWVVGRYSVKTKGIITAGIILLILVGHTSDKVYNQGSSYDIGYLKAGSAWEDNKGKAHYNSKLTKIEIWKGKIITANGIDMIQIYFLEGENAGDWGYTREEFLSR